MKFKLKINRRHNTYYMLVACAVGLWMMITRFDLQLSKIAAYAAIIVVFVLLVIAGSALAAKLYRLIADK